MRCAAMAEPSSEGRQAPRSPEQPKAVPAARGPVRVSEVGRNKQKPDRCETRPRGSQGTEAPQGRMPVCSRDGRPGRDLECEASGDVQRAPVCARLLKPARAEVGESGPPGFRGGAAEQGTKDRGEALRNPRKLGGPLSKRVDGRAGEFFGQARPGRRQKKRAERRMRRGVLHTPGALLRGCMPVPSRAGTTLHAAARSSAKKRMRFGAMMPADAGITPTTWSGRSWLFALGFFMLFLYAFLYVFIVAQPLDLNIEDA